MNAYQHYALLMRTPRALALRRIIEQEVRPGMRVLDAGCGSGLLSLWAAQAGATVLGVDMADVSLARALAVENNVHDRVTFIQGNLHNVGLEEQGPFDVLLAMVYLNDPRRDEAASELVFKLKRYMRPNAVLVPDQVRYTAQALDCPEQEHALRMGRIDRDVRSLEQAFGLRLDPFRSALAHRPTKEMFPHRRDDGTLELPGAVSLSAPEVIHTVDYGSTGHAFPAICTIPITTGGRCTTVQWTQELRFKDQLIFSNSSIGWLDPARNVSPGERIALETGQAWREDNLLKWS